MYLLIRKYIYILRTEFNTPFMENFPQKSTINKLHDYYLDRLHGTLKSICTKISQTLLSGYVLFYHIVAKFIG